MGRSSANGNIALFSEIWVLHGKRPPLPSPTPVAGQVVLEIVVLLLFAPMMTPLLHHILKQESRGTVTEIELPVAQKWRKVIFVETDSFMPNQYLAIGGINSSIAAISMSGWAWQISSLPVAQEWRSAFAGKRHRYYGRRKYKFSLDLGGLCTLEEITLRGMQHGRRVVMAPMVLL